MMWSVAKPAELRTAIATSIADKVKAYNLAEFCVSLGLAPQAENEFPDNSKRVYVRIDT